MQSGRFSHNGSRPPQESKHSYNRNSRKSLPEITEPLLLGEFAFASTSVRARIFWRHVAEHSYPACCPRGYSRSTCAD
jgi:hypothetical protein